MTMPPRSQEGRPSHHRPEDAFGPLMALRRVRHCQRPHRQHGHIQHGHYQHGRQPRQVHVFANASASSERDRRSPDRSGPPFPQSMTSGGRLASSSAFWAAVGASPGSASLAPNGLWAAEETRVEATQPQRCLPPRNRAGARRRRRVVRIHCRQVAGGWQLTRAGRGAHSSPATLPFRVPNPSRRSAWRCQRRSGASSFQRRNAASTSARSPRDGAISIR